MKKNILKRVGLASLTIISAVSLSNTVNAAQACKTHKNYYFFNDMSVYSTLSKGFDSQESVIHKGTAYFPALEKGAKIIEDQTGKICLKKGDKIDGDCLTNITSWSLDELYQNSNSYFNGGTDITLDINGTQSKYKIYTEEKDDVINTYLSHNTWFKSEQEGDLGGGGVNYYSIDKKTLNDGSFLPSSTTIKRESKENYFAVSLTRTIKKEDLQDIKPFDLIWHTGEEITKTVLAPAVYLITYETCEDKYKETITYYCKDGNKTTKCELDPNPYTKDNLEDGYTEKVKSPEIKNCTPDKKEVDVLIKGADFSEDVYYSCTVDNPKTGSALIYIAWAVGLGALGYSIYYFTKLRKTKETN